jgi:hypothetical protein
MTAIHSVVSNISFITTTCVNRYIGQSRTKRTLDLVHVELHRCSYQLEKKWDKCIIQGINALSRAESIIRIYWYTVLAHLAWLSLLGDHDCHGRNANLHICTTHYYSPGSRKTNTQTLFFIQQNEQHIATGSYSLSGSSDKRSWTQLSVFSKTKHVIYDITNTTANGIWHDNQLWLAKCELANIPFSGPFGAYHW